MTAPVELAGARHAQALAGAAAHRARCAACGRARSDAALCADGLALALIERAARRELAAAQREEPPVTARASSRAVICANCGKRLHRQRDGAWYHDHNASVSCRPGEGSARRAEPREVTR